MKSSEILREAARLIELGLNDCGCAAIMAAAHWEKPAIRAAMEPFLLFSPPEKNENEVWWGASEMFWTGEHRDARIIGLCLAAAISESEGD